MKINIYKKEIVFGSVFVIVILVLLLWLTSLSEFDIWKISTAGAITLVLLFVSLHRMKKIRRATSNNLIKDDEFSIKARRNAGNIAFHYSMYLWILIFVFSESFPESREMLGFGILASAAIYGVSIWYFKSTADFDE